MTALRIMVAGVVALMAAATPALAAAPGIAPLADRFPERSFILTLPKPAELGSESVTLRENGAPVADLSVSPAAEGGGGGAAVALVIDASNSMRGAAIEAAVDAARAFAAQRTPNLAIGVITFNRRHTVLLRPTTNGSAIESALATLPPLADGTRFYDTLGAAIDMLQGTEARTKTVVLLSDGSDVGSTRTSADVVAHAKSAGIRLFTVGIESNDFDPAPLRELAVQTRASYAEGSVNAISAIFEGLGRALSSEYLIEYTSRVGPGTAVDVVARVDGFEGAALASYTSPALPTSVRGFAPSVLDRILQSTWLLFAIVLLCAALAAYAVTQALPASPSDSVTGRIGLFVAPPRDAERERVTAALSTKILVGTERSLRRLQRWPEIKEALDVAQIRIPAEQIAVFTVVGALFAGWLLNFLFGPLAAIAAIFAVPTIVFALARRKLVLLQRKFAEQLPDNLEVLASALRAGHSLGGALSVVVSDAAEPSRREFRRVVANEQLGVPLEEALLEPVRRMANRDLEQVVLIASLQKRAGGDAAEVLDRVTETVRGRQEVRRLVRTLTAQGRLARWIVTILPIALFLLVSVVNPAYTAELYNRTGGIVLLVVAATLVTIGSLLIKRIVEIKI